MSRPFDIRLPLEQGYVRNALFAIELLDPVTLSRVSDGIKVVAEGLRGRPIVNGGGLFVWLKEDLTPLQKISIDPGTLPYDRFDQPRSALTLPPAPVPVTTFELPPRVDYVFAAGITGIRGRLIEDRTASPVQPVRDADVHLRWLDEDGVTWHDAPTHSRTNENGEFVSIARLGPTEVPRVDANGALTLRFRATRSGATERGSADLKVPQGRVADPTTLNALTFAWDELQP